MAGEPEIKQEAAAVEPVSPGSPLGIGPLEEEAATDELAAATPEVSTTPGPSTPETPAPTAGLVPAEMLALQQEVRQRDELLQQAVTRLQEVSNQQEVQRQQAAWAAQGYTEEQIAAGVRSLEQVQGERMQLAQARAQVQQGAVTMQREHQAKVRVALHLGKEYGLSFEDLMRANSPTEMENLGLKAQLAKQKQAPLPPPQSFANNSPGGVQPASKERDEEEYITTGGRGMSVEKLRRIFPDRY